MSDSIDLTGSEVHPLIEKIIEIEWASEEPKFFDDWASDANHQIKRFRVQNIQQGLVCLQRDLSEGVHGAGPHLAVWVTLSQIAAIRVIR